MSKKELLQRIEALEREVAELRAMPHTTYVLPPQAPISPPPYIPYSSGTADPMPRYPYTTWC